MSESTFIEISDNTLERLPIFPLGNAVLFPNTDIPLHIFEPRYRQLMDDIIDKDRLFALALLNKDESAMQKPTDDQALVLPPVYPIAGLGLVRSAARLPDGLYNIVVRGIARVDISQEIIEPNSNRLYRVVSAKLQRPQEQDNDDALKQEFAAFHSLTHRVFSRIKKVKIEFDEKIENREDMSYFIDLVSSMVLPSVESRQSVLACSSLRQRMQITTSALAELLIKTQSFDGGSSDWGIA